MSPEYLLTTFVVCLAPGIGVVYTLSVALAQGMKGGFWAAVGCTLATLFHMGVAMAELAAVLFQAVKFAGVGYLLWMAWGTLKGVGGLDVQAAEPQPALRIVRRGVLLNLLNPKLPMFFLAFLPQFLSSGDGTPAIVALGLGFAAMTFAVFLGYAAVAATGREAVLSRPAVMAWLRRAFAASFAALGLRLALERA